MTNVFGLTVFAGIGLGYLFPYTALSLAEYGFVFLFFLMFLAGFSVDWGRLRRSLSTPWPILLALGLLFILLPLLQWHLTSLFIDNQRLASGLLFASLMPVAMVAPYFSKKGRGDSELSYAVLLVSTLITPVVSPLLFYFIGGAELPIKTGPLMLSVGLFALVPFLASAALAVYFPRLKESFAPRLGWMNAVTLGTLIFILFGAVVMKLNVNYISDALMLKILVAAVLQDFGVYFLLLYFLKFFTDPVVARTLAISLAMKNVAISAGVLLFYDPQAALPSAIIFVAHGFLFVWLGRGTRATVRV